MTNNHILAAICLTVGILTGFYASSDKQKVKQLTSINKELRDSVTTYKNKYGEEVSKKAAAEASLKLLQESYADNFDWIKQHMGIQAKNVRGIFKAVTETTGSGEAIVDTIHIIENDELIRFLEIKDSTKWFSINGTFRIGGNTTRARLSNPFNYTYTVRDNITLVPYMEGRNLYVKGISANPNTRITGLHGILVSTTPRKKSWGIGPSIQIGYDTQIRITPGISLQYSLIKF